MPPPTRQSAERSAASFARLADIMRLLRAPRGCPWDRQQTHESLRPYLLEESYEALDAIDRGDTNALCGELGDVLLQCVFHAQLAAEAGTFDLAMVVDALVDKLVRRHPHVFRRDGTPLTAREHRQQTTTTAGAVVERWAAIKAQEQDSSGGQPGVLAGLPRALPALLRASKIGARVATVGFDWIAADDVLAKIEEEVQELRAAMRLDDAARRDEMGDVLFSIANLARKLQIDPEQALTEANDKFTRRFAAVEAFLEARHQSVHDATPAALEAAWQHIKAAPPTRAPAKTPRSPSSPASRARRSRR